MATDAKICGITTLDALEAAIAGGARYIGLVFFAKSPRNVSLAAARRLADAARGRVKIVALLVDADDDAVRAILDGVAPDVLQLHGSETPERVADIRTRFGRPVIKAIGVATPADVAAAERYQAVADMILFDAKPSPGAALPGGMGRTFDWNLLRGQSSAQRFMLSGGLSPDTVAEAIRQTGAAAVDVSSGVESAPGIKDAALIDRFLQAVKTANQG